MKLTFTHALTLVLCTTVSSYALAASDAVQESDKPLLAPPAATNASNQTKYYNPSPRRAAPVETTKAAATPAPAAAVTVKETPAKAAAGTKRYVPSVPERAVEAAPVAPTPSAKVSPKVAADTVTSTPVVNGKRYVPSVPARDIQASPVTPDVAKPAASEIEKTRQLNSIKSSAKPAATSPAQAMAAPIAKAPAATAVKGLDSALAEAYNFNPELKSFRSRLKSIDEQIPQAYSGWLPSASAEYDYGYSQETVNKRKQNGTHPGTKSISVTQPVFNGGETIARTRRAFNTVEIGRAQLDGSEQNVLLDAVKAYIDVVRTAEILKLSTNNEEVLKEQLQATNDRFQLGETTRTDVAQSEARLARANSDKVRASGDYDVAKSTYLRVIGSPAQNIAMPTKLPALPATLEQALSVGLENNPNLRAADFTRNVADQDVDIAIAAILPDVSVRAAAIRQDNLSVSRGLSSDEDLVTMQLRIPIFQQGAEYSRVRQNKRTREQRLEEYEATHNETVEKITSTWRDIHTARASIIANKSAVDSAAVALEGVRQEADVGTRTTLDVLDAEQELFLAKVNLVTAQSREVIAVYSLLAQIGKMKAQDLALNVDTYNPDIHEDHVKYKFIGF